ncbi:MAG: DHH family phosphoesterase [Planctomycetota bacterium]
MCGKSAAEAFEAVVGRLRSAASILVVTHARPDGDALGSMVALARAGQAAGKTVRLLSPDPVPRRYELLCSQHDFAGPGQFAALARAADLIVVLDTCTFSQLEDLEVELRRWREKIAAVDHHATVDDIGAVQWVDTSAAAAGVMVAEIVEALGWPVDLPTAEALTTAVVTDTGWLRFANTDGRCLRLVARWLELGVRPDKLYKQIYQADRPQRLALMSRMLQTLELHAGDRLAAMTIRKSDFEATGATPEETENLVNEALRLASVDTAILLVENDDCVRVSLRSRDAVNVAEVARRFGGGGHARAAGVRLNEDIDAIKKRLIEACSRELRS